MNITDTRLKIAVFIDFDNVEIGVRSTIGGQFDIGPVLEAIKERGEIVTKIAYSDWKRAGDYSRLLTQHAIRMVQRNFTPGGDKNGADITMALDALEMAFTHEHINAFVIVGGDSDFISLVEKLKQYDRKVFVVGGRQFTSATMQRNCHEFIAYENLPGVARPARGADRSRHHAGSSIAQALPLVRRALKVLSEREVTPQLGLLKSTLLQLDSTFSERDYGAGSFRDFMEKVAEAGAVTLKQAGRSMLVEAVEDDAHAEAEAPGEDVASGGDVARATPLQSRGREPRGRDSRDRDSRRRGGVSPLDDARGALSENRRATPSPPQAPASTVDVDEDEMPTGPMAMAEGIRAVRQAFSEGTPRWPMYVRQAKHFLRTAIEGFDERRYGFASLVDLLRAAAKEGVVRLDRDRQGVMRVFQGSNLKQAPVVTGEPVEAPADVSMEVVPEAVAVEQFEGVVETAHEPPIIDVQPIGEVAPPQAASVEAEGGQKKRRRRPPRAAKSAKASKASKPRPSNGPRQGSGQGPKPRGRKPARSKAEAADVQRVS
jgi:uncharacterized LabA/DUF88 family protein